MSKKYVLFLLLLAAAQTATPDCVASSCGCCSADCGTACRTRQCKPNYTYNPITAQRQAQLDKEFNDLFQAYTAPYNDRFKQAEAIWLAHQDTVFAEIKDWLIEERAHREEFKPLAKQLIEGARDILETLPHLQTIKTTKDLFATPQIHGYIQTFDDFIRVMENTYGNFVQNHKTPWFHAMFGRLPSVRPLVMGIFELMKNPANDILLLGNAKRAPFSEEERAKALKALNALIGCYDELWDAGKAYNIAPILNQLDVLHTIHDKTWANPQFTKNIALLACITAQSALAENKIREILLKHGVLEKDMCKEAEDTVVKFSEQLCIAMNKLRDDRWFDQLKKEDQTDLQRLYAKLCKEEKN